VNGYKYHHHVGTTNMDYNSYHELTTEAQRWCTDQFGEMNSERWGYFIDGFNFNDEKDYTLFLLRWS